MSTPLPSATIPSPLQFTTLLTAIMTSSSSSSTTISSSILPTTTTHKNQYEGIEQNTGGLNNSAKAGIGVAGGIAAVILFSAIGMNIVSLRRRRRRRQRRQRRGRLPPEEEEEGSSTQGSRVATVELGGKARRELGMRGSAPPLSAVGVKKLGSERKSGVEEVKEVNGKEARSRNENEVVPQERQSIRQTSKLPKASAVESPSSLYPPNSPHSPPLSPPPSSPLPSPPVEAHLNHHHRPRSSRSRSRSRDGRNVGRPQ